MQLKEDKFTDSALKKPFDFDWLSIDFKGLFLTFSMH